MTTGSDPGSDARENRRLAQQISRRFQSRFHRHYAAAKIGSDPVYAASRARVTVNRRPILDLGCGLGILAMYLAESGASRSILGIDTDERKIEAARQASVGLHGLRFEVGDARERRDFSGNVLLLDVLHYFPDEDQRLILSNAADCARVGDIVVVRDCIRDGTWRFRLTWLEETFATSIGWLRGERLNFPTTESIVREFRERGFDEEVVPLWGRTPFNNYLLTFRRR